MAARGTIPNEATAVLYPTNVHCADCVRDMISGVLLEKGGVTKAFYDAATGALSVTYRPEITGEDEIRATISELGYGFAEEGSVQAAQGSARANATVVVVIVVALIMVILVIRSMGG